MTQDTAAFVDSRRDNSGSLIEVGDRRPTLEAARFGVEVLNLLGDQPTGDDLRMLADCQRGPAFAMTRETEHPALGATYYGNRLLQLARQEVGNATATSRWVT